MENKRKGTITKKMIEDGESVIYDMDKFDEWMKFINSVEPEYFEFVNSITGKMVSRISQNIKISLQDGQKIAQCIMSGFIFGYVVTYEKDRKKVEELLKDSTNKDRFEKWLDGRMPAKFYNFPLTGLPKESSVYQAKKKFMERIKKEKRDIDLVDAEKRFNEISSNVKNGDEEMFLDEDLRGIDGK